MNRPQLKALEKCRPGGIHGGGICTPALVVLIEQIGIGTVRERDGHGYELGAEMYAHWPTRPNEFVFS